MSGIRCLSVVLLLTTAVLVVAAESVKVDFVATDRFEEFKKTHGKQYESAEVEAFRRAVFTDNMNTALHLNARDPHAHYVPSNQFADLAPQEFADQYLSTVTPNKKTRRNIQATNHRRAKKLAKLKAGRGAPVEVEVDATSWQLYNSGVVSYCGSHTPNHVVVVVGYNSTANPPYWIVKNSWGPGWGEDGYIRIAIESSQCLIPGTAAKGGRHHSHHHKKKRNGMTTPGDKETSQLFVQKNCFNSECSLLCFNTTYRSEACVPMSNGRSAIVHCQSTTVVQDIYTTSDCSGDAEQVTMPLNKCIQSYLGYFENICTTPSERSLQRAATVMDISTPHALGQPRLA